MKKNHTVNSFHLSVKVFTTLLFLFFCGQTFAQGKIISGKVTDSVGNPLQLVSVIEKGTSNGTSTDAKGYYKISVKPNATLVFSSVNHGTSEVNVSGKKEIDVELTSYALRLSDVVVVAYGTQQRAKMTSSQSSISSEDFKGQPVTRLDQALQGRAAGVQVTNSTGAPGGDVRIRIRGASSITGSNDPLYVVDGFVGGDFNTINPDDVADIQILKDAAATAPYGSRGANGVVIITTKKGSKGNINLSLTSRLSASKIVKTYDVLNAADFADVVNARNTLAGTSPTFSPDQIEGFRKNGGTDWQKEIYRTGLGRAYEGAVSGGSAKTNYYISGSYQDQEGIIKNSNYKFYSLRSNVNARLTDKLSTYINISGFVRNNQNTFLNSGTANPVVQALAWAPTTPAYDQNGNYTRKDPIGSQAYNPLAEAYDRLAQSNDYSVNVAGGLLYNIVSSLSLNIQYGVNFDNGQYKSFGTPYVSENSYATRNFSNNLNLQNINTLNYKHTFNGVHNLDVTALMEVQKDRSEGFGANVSNLIYTDFKWNNLSLATFNGLNSSLSKAALFSLFGRINYSFKDKYLLSGSIRRDGSSKFRDDNKYSTFPAVSAGWLMSKENFIADMGIFKELKLRGSWGLTGNQAVAPYSTLATYSNVSTIYNSSSTPVPGLWINMAENPNLKWETTEQKDVGLDIGLFKGSITANIDYFVKNTRDLLLWSGLPAFTGGGGIMLNVGNVQNSGWEFTLGASPFDTKKFSWNTNFNFSILKNKVVKLSQGGNDDWQMSSGTNWGSKPDFRLKSGESMGAINGVKFLGTWKPSEAAEAAKYGNVPGDSKYLDVNGDHVIDESDDIIIGHGMPKFSLGWNNTVTYKRITLNIFTQGLMGLDKYNYIYGMMVSTFGDFKQPTSADIKNRYIPGVNETSDIPAFSSTNKNIPLSSRFLSKADFIRIKNVSLSYTIPKNTLKNIGAIKLFVSVVNLITFTNYNGLDPEASNSGSGSDVFQNFDYGSYPIPRVFTGGVTLTF
ncbi:MAG: TonB-dependent receptor [Ferruginibacter sp.]